MIRYAFKFFFAVWNFWTPACISNKLGNLGCTTPSVTDVAGGVTCWKDKSPLSISYNSTITGTPTLKSTGWSNGKPTVYFDGNSDLYRLGLNIIPKNIISAVKVNVNDNLDGLVGNTGADMGLRIEATVPSKWTATGLLGLTADFTYPTGTFYVNGSVNALHSLVEHIIVANKADSTNVWSGVGIGGYMNLLGIPDRRINANVSEMIICTTDCTTSQTKIEGYLAHKWGFSANLPSGHAYKNSPP